MLKPMLKLAGLGMLNHIVMLEILNTGTKDSIITRLFKNNRGEAGGEGGEGGGEGGEGGGKAFSQEDVNRILANNRREVEGKFADYKELADFKKTHEQTQSEQEKKMLEEKGNYAEAKKGYEKQIGDFQSVIETKNQTISSMQVGYALQSEASIQGAYPEAVELMRSKAVIQEDGSVKIKGKDANGIDTLLDVKQGVEQFLKEKPYLVKANAQGGSGSGTGAGQGGTGGTGGGASGENQASLNDQLAAAMSVGNHKLVAEISQKLKNLQSSRSISAII